MDRDAEGHPRILIIRPSALGDVCRTVPALVTLRRAYPQAKIDWLVRSGNTDAIRYHPALDELVEFPLERIARFYASPRAARGARRWAGDLRRRRYDIVYDLQGLLRSGVVAWLTRAPQRVGYANARELGWIGCNRRHHVSKQIHSVDRMLALLEAQGLELHHDMTLYHGASELHWLEELLGPTGGLGRPYVCLAPTARWRCKCWPLERYTLLAERLMKEHPAAERIVLLAAPDEHAQLQPLLDRLAAGGATVLLPQTTVGQMMALISRTALLVCNDSAAMHMAVGFDRPVVAIFGPTDPQLVGPYRRPQAVVQPPDLRPQEMTGYRRRRDDQSLISRVGLDAVWQKVLEQAPPAGGVLRT